VLERQFIRDAAASTIVLTARLKARKVKINPTAISNTELLNIALPPAGAALQVFNSK